MTRTQRGCSVPGCERRHYGNGYCQLHNRRLRENGDPLTARSYGTTSCSVPGCDAPHHANGYCNSHGQRARRHGDPLAGAERRDHGPLVDRILSRCTLNESTGCWDWSGAAGPMGHGRVSIGGRILRPTHCVTYEHFISEIPDGLVLDHMCERPCCCNPYHLDPVTSLENLRRGREGRN